MNAYDATWWIQAMGGQQSGDRTITLGQPFGGVYPISYTYTARSGGLWFLFGHKLKDQLNQPECARILQHIGE